MIILKLPDYHNLFESQETPQLFLKDLHNINSDNMKTPEDHVIDKFNFYFYKNTIYYFDDKDFHTQEEQELLIKEYHFKHDRRFNRLKKEIRLFEKFERGEIVQREPIPEDMRNAVWIRDGGKCVICGDNKNLEFDHIIPVSKGGSSTERNVQLLCEKCNRGKSNKV